MLQEKMNIILFDKGGESQSKTDEIRSILKNAQKKRQTENVINSKAYYKMILWLGERA